MDTTLCNDKKKKKKRKGKDNKVHDITVHKTMEQLQNTLVWIGQCRYMVEIDCKHYWSS